MTSHILPPITPYIPEPECTSKCRSPVHACMVMSVITRANDEEVMAYLQWLCSNHYHLIDGHGRTALHMAASCGKRKVLRWLLNKRLTDCNPRDWESGWTPLHRSLYYGQLTAAKLLIDHGANMFALDHDRLSPLDLVMLDRPKFMVYRSSGLYEAYMWGINHNYNLGLGIQQSKPSPELLDTFRRENISIIQVVMCKFHTMFLTQGGQVFACGHGHGGRLGLPVERTVLTPQLLKAVSKEICIQIACGTDHSVLLMESGSVWTCGTNTQHQLGHVPAMEKLLTPKPITGNKIFKSHIIMGICAGRYHSVVYTKEVIFTFGLNAGQLGHPSIGDKLQTVPRVVSALSNQEIEFTHVTASDGATICITKKGDIFALHEYQCRKIASKRYDVVQVLASGGCLDTKADLNALREGGGTELRVVFLTNIGEIYVWSEHYPQVTRCLLSIGRHLHVVDVALFNEGLLFVTSDGEGFIGNFIPPKLHSRKCDDNAGRQPTSHLSKQMVTSFLNFLDRNECAYLKAKRLTNVHRATAVACDHKGRNFAVLQAHPKSNLLEVPQLSESEMALNMLRSLQESDPCDNIHDIIIKLGHCQFASHKYILALHCEFFRSEILKKNPSHGDDDSCVILSDLHIHPSVLQQILEFLYTNTCKLLTNGETFNLTDSSVTNGITSNSNAKCIAEHQPDLIASTLSHGHHVGSDRKKKSSKKEIAVAKKSKLDPVKLMEAAAKKLGISALGKRLANVQFLDGRINVNSLNNNSVNKPKFDRMKLPELYDVTIKCEDGKEIQCHKCVLVARSEYFHSMLASNWIETKKLSSLSMPILSGIMDIVIDCLYTDEVPKLMSSEDAEFVCNTLTIADRLLISRLKELCEIRLTDLLTLRNVTELLEFSWVYNALQLKATCMQFIGLNLPALLEAKSLSILSDEVLVELTKNYRALITQMSYRAVTPYSDGPCLEDIQAITQMFPVKFGEDDNDEGDSIGFKGNHAQEGKKLKTKRKSHVRKISWVSEEATGSRSRNESTSSVGSSATHISDLVELTKGLVIESNTAHQEFAQQRQLNIPLSPSTQSAPMQNLYNRNVAPKWLEGNEDMNSAFPDLLNKLQRQWYPGASDQYKSSSDSFKKSQKLSQKQRKILASKQVSAPKPIPPELFSEYLINPWAATAMEYKIVAPLKDIMDMEKGSEPSKMNTSSPSGHQHSALLSPESPKQLENAWNSRQIMTSTTNAATERHSPGNVMPDSEPCSKDFTPCFSDILRTEQEEFHNLSKISTKPLHLIQLEDQAIDELLHFYNAHNNPDERIKVERVTTQHVATPIWKPHKSSRI